MDLPTPARRRSFPARLAVVCVHVCGDCHPLMTPASHGRSLGSMPAGALTIAAAALCCAAWCSPSRQAVLYPIGAVQCDQREAAQVTAALGAALSASRYFEAVWQLADSDTSGAEVMGARDPLGAFPVPAADEFLVQLSGAVIKAPDGTRHVQVIARRAGCGQLGAGLASAWSVGAPVPTSRLLAETARAIGPLAHIVDVHHDRRGAQVRLGALAPLPAGTYAVCEAVEGAGQPVLTRAVGKVTLGIEAEPWRRASRVRGALRRGLWLALETPYPLRWPSLTVPALLRTDPPLAAVSLQASGRFLGTTPCLAALPPGPVPLRVSYRGRPQSECRAMPLGAARPPRVPVIAIPGAAATTASPGLGTGPLASSVNLPLREEQLETKEPSGPSAGAIGAGVSRDDDGLGALRELPPGQLWPQYPLPTRRLALTFDDFPSDGLSNQLLTVLRENEAPATFFVIGHKGRKSPDLLRQAVAEGHVLGNHTYSHTRLGAAGRQQTQREIVRCSEVIESVTGWGTRYFRPPGGQTNASMPGVLKGLGMRMVMWNAAAADYENPPPQKIVADVLKNTGLRDGVIVNLHDGHLPTIRAMPELIHQLRLRGFALVTVDELL